jgi:hypothetical protein
MRLKYSVRLSVAGKAGLQLLLWLRRVAMEELLVPKQSPVC